MRAYTNYLTPDPGAVSNDTWQAVTIWLRTTLVTWSLFAPLLLAAAALPILHLLAFCLLTSNGLRVEGIAILLGLLGVACLCHAILHGCLLLPSHGHPDVTSGQQHSKLGSSARVIFCSITCRRCAPGPVERPQGRARHRRLQRDAPARHRLLDAALRRLEAVPSARAGDVNLTRA